MRRVGPVVLVATLLVPVAAARSAPAARAIRFRVDRPFIRDAAGRVRFFHGVNAVWKKPPYYPPSSLYGAPRSRSFFDDRDARLLAETGLNTVRLGLIWAGLEPRRDRFDDRYLDRMKRLVRTLGAHGVTVLLDFHQDMYNERYDGEGFPDWATSDDGIPATNCCGFPGNYGTPAATQAFNNLWLNRDGLWDEYREAWAHVVRRFRDEANVLGYDLINEPWPGSHWPSCFSASGCPQFDVGFLQPFYEHVAAGIRRVDASGIVFWEPNVVNEFGPANHVGTVEPIRAGANAISFHSYCIVGGTVPGVGPGDDPECQGAKEVTLQRQREAADRNRSAPFLTEFGATDDLVDVERTMALADREMISWQYWHYGEWVDPTTSGEGGAQSMFRDDLKRPESLKQAKADVLIRTYPQAIAGTPRSFSFDLDTKEFRLVYETVSSIREPTVIFVPVARHYGGHYAAAVTGPARVTSEPDAPLLTLKSKGPGTVSVTVTKA